LSLSIGKTRLRVHPLALMFPIAAALLGAKADVAALALGLAIHEGAHLLATRCLGVGIAQLRLMPFGAAIAMENPYALAPSRLLGVAAAGPAGSAVALLAAAALAHWGVLDPPLAGTLARVNLTLLLFNLLPALPLDGGRMLYALLCPRLGPSRAAEAGVRAGRAVALGLLAASLWALWRRGRCNLSHVFAAVFILASAADERRALSDTRAAALLDALKPVGRPVPARLVAVGEGCDVGAALRAVRPDATTLYAVYRDSCLWAVTDNRRLLEAALARGPGIPVREALRG